MHRARGLLLLAALGVIGCGHRSPYGTTDGALVLDRVVLYRSGIGYFERQGDVDGDVLTIKVRKDQVNDLLKSLTVVEQGTGKTLSVSMPLDPQTWANAALGMLAPGSGNLPEVLDALRGTEVVVRTQRGRHRGRIVMVEEIVGEAPEVRPMMNGVVVPNGETHDYKLTLMRGQELEVVYLSKVRSITLRDGDLALQLHRSLDASAGEGMFEQVEVAIRLADAKKHEVLVSYVVGAPVWKPTYRVVLPEGDKGEALLQAWAVVDNVSGEDWRDVTMSLTSGAPIAFRYDLHTPRSVERSDLSEAGTRKRATVAMGETSYDQRAPPPAAAGAAERYAEAEEMYDYYDADEDMAPTESKKLDKAKEKRAEAGEKRRASAKPSRPMPAPTTKSPAAPSTGYGGMPANEPQRGPVLDRASLQRSMQADARARSISGLTAFDLERRVTVPDGTSTMVALVNQGVEAEQTFLFRPGGAGVGYEVNPYRVVRFRNSTPFILEPGPISIYAAGSFVGEGLSEAVGAGSSATIPFAVEPSIMVSSQVAYSGAEMRIVKIVRGVLECENFQRTTTTWNVKARAEKKAQKVLIRHPKFGPDYALQERPKDTEDLADAYLIPVVVAAGKAEASVSVVEQTPSRLSLTIWDGRAPELIQALLSVPGLDPTAREKLQPIIALRQEIGRIDTELDGLRAQQIEFDQRADETRQNLEAIKKDPRASDLRARLSKRLEEFTSGADKIGRQLVELQSRRLEKKIELEDRLQTLDLAAPTPPPETKPAAGKR
ncbi:MAG: DUF4139 domain-containing protein [Nannocystaceae bacterium]